MNAQPLLARIAAALSKEKLEAILVGNAGAALHGAPVTTLDFDFVFRATPLNLAKLKRVAKSLGAVIMRPYYPVSNLYRLESPEQALQLDFMPRISGVSSFNGLRARATQVTFGTATLQVASLEDIIKSKKAANRGIAPCCPRWRQPLRSRKIRKAPRKSEREAEMPALTAENDRVLEERILALLAKPMNERTHFLRVRIPGVGTCL